MNNNHPRLAKLDVQLGVRVHINVVQVNDKKVMVNFFFFLKAKTAPLSSKSLVFSTSVLIGLAFKNRECSYT
jgi:hypothetical protein